MHNSGWCRPIASIQVAVLPVMLAAFLYLHSLPGWMKAPATMGLVFVGSLLVGVGLGALVFHTSANDEPPKYHNLLAFLGFFVAILWIYATSEELVNVILAFGMVFDVGRTVLGITILAIGVGMQDLITNVGVAHAGMTRMAISACVGAPLLNMYFAMGISAVAGNVLVVSPYPIAMTVHLFVCISFLVVSVITAMALLSYSGFQGGYVYGATMISLYAAFLITSIFFEIYIDEDDWGFGMAHLIG
jgi:sodium/potassium/calcium exchanger 6